MTTQNRFQNATISSDDESVIYESYDLGLTAEAYDRLLVAMQHVHAEKAKIACRIDALRGRAPFAMPPVPIAA